jgi:hypothetical protein
MLNNNQLFENLAPNTSVGTFSAEDLESNNSIIFSMIDGNGSNHNHLFSIESNGTLKTSSILDFESNESLRIHVKARDTNHSSIEKTFRINVLNIVEDFDNDGIEDYFDSDDDNDSFSDAVEIAYGSDPLNPNSVANKAPNKISISNNTFHESQPIGLFIGKLSATDPDINSTHSFSFVDRNNSTHNQLFEIDKNHSIRTNSLFKFSNEKDHFIIRVNAKDEHNASYAQELYIRIIKDENQSVRLGKPDVFIDAIGRVSFSTPIKLDNDSHLKFKPSYEEWVKGGQNIPEELVFLGGSPWFNEETGENRSSTEVYNMIFGDSNSTLPEFNYLFSKHSDFSTIALSRPAIFGSGNLKTSVFDLDENDTYFARVESVYDDKIIISESVNFRTPFVSDEWWKSLNKKNNAGWRESEWLGTFLPHKSGWIYHQSIGWLYAHPGKENDFWFWSSEFKWIWTKNGIYPFLFRNNTSNWIYILGEKDGRAVFHDYSEEQNF